MQYKWAYTIEYDIEADNAQDAISEIAYIIGQNWIEYADNGNLVEQHDEEGG